MTVTAATRRRIAREAFDKACELDFLLSLAFGRELPVGYQLKPGATRLIEDCGRPGERVVAWLDVRPAHDLLTRELARPGIRDYRGMVAMVMLVTALVSDPGMPARIERLGKAFAESLRDAGS